MLVRRWVACWAAIRSESPPRHILVDCAASGPVQSLVKGHNVKCMNTKQHWLGLLCGAALLAASSASAADAKTYQVTGPVLEITATTITVQKGNDKWEIARDSKTKVSGDLKVGAKVTIYYTMTATEVEVKEAKGKKETKK